MKKPGLFTWIIIGFAVGIFAGLVAGDLMLALKPFGDLFVRLLKMLIVPLVFATLVVGVASISPAKLGRMGGWALLFYYGTGIIAVSIGLILANITRIGTGMPIGELAAVEAKAAPALSQVLLNIVPTNPVGAMAQGQILPIIFFAILFGIALNLAGKVAEPLYNIIDGMANAMFKLVRIVLYYAPIGVFALIGWTVAKYGAAVLLPFAALIAVCYLGYILHVGITYSLLLRFVAKVNPWKWLRAIKEAPVFAFVTCSSSATLPVTMRVCRENTGMSKETSGFILPAGSTLNMDGTGLYQGVAAIFLANAFGMDIGIVGNITILITALLASIGTAGVPGAGLIMLMVVMGAVGIPLEGVAIIAGIDRILDMGRTAVNIIDDTVCAAVISRFEGEKLSPEVVVG
ncbi:MAG: dicarboxylate/amino acid:cation symporter [Anaerolineales bacterium]|nr:dicarboxylate/amino acid:cation symporter [Anaerolineales bacterium]